jgi:LPS O-antigen subunit length determinant protein (WzzB/FepE family)
MNPEHPTHNQPYPSAHSSYDDEIDLWQLVSTLWAGKLWIIGIAIICGLLGLWFAKTTEEEWTAKAQVIAPDYADFQQATEYTQKLLPILDDKTLEEKIKAIKFNDGDAAFTRFISLFNSIDNKKEFLQQHEILDQYKKAQGPDAGSEEKILARWASSITAAAPKTEPNNFDLSATSWTATNSQKLLADYIDFTNNQVIKELQVNLTSLLATRVNELESQLSTREYNAKMNIEREINRLTHSLAIAKAAGIQTPIVDPGTKDVFEINLGQKAIQAKITELKSITNLAVMNVEILNIQSQLAEAEAIEFSSLPVFNSYKFTQRPAVPLSRDAPKTILIILAGIIVGGILGVIYVLLSHAIRSRTKTA